MGCDLVQGWHLARPMPVDALLPWLDAGTPAVHARGTVHAV
jgi:EAL domain-containing protein (putative c-di-GMP-specific phosphodiesterase class I)